MGTDFQVPKMRSKAIDSKTIFCITSPRTPFKSIPEIALLDEELHGCIWDKESQKKFYYLLRDRDFFESDNAKEPKEPELAGRDRINRLPKALGFVQLPVIGLTEAGKELLTSNNKEEILLRQMLKFQLPSPYHPLGKKAASFWVKPYLEILRLIRVMGTLSFDELQIFAMQVIDYRMFDDVVKKIHRFRIGKQKYVGKYAAYKLQVINKEVSEIFEEEIKTGNLKTRESKTATVASFITKKANNLRDYADAATRYFRATGLIKVSAIGKSLSILPDKIKDVDYILSTIPRDPVYVNEQKSYEAYLWNPSLPKLLTDDREMILSKLKNEFNIIPDKNLSINQLKDTLNAQIEKRKEDRISQQVVQIKNYKLYNDIEETFNNLNSTFEPSLFFEWNTWRAMTMLNGGTIKANLKFDDEGNPMNTALGKMADIECYYDDFDVIVEVSLSSGQLQFKMEGEPVPRHIGIHKQQTNKTTYCFFIAPTINSATIAHFYSLYLSNIEMYGGKCNIIPLTLDTFRKMLRDAFNASKRPAPSNIKRLFDTSNTIAKKCLVEDKSEMDWYEGITKVANNWLSA